MLWDTTTYFLEDHVRRFDSRYMQNPEVDFLLVGSEPHSTSTKQRRVKLVFGVKRIPKRVVPTTYLKMHLSTCQCCRCGWCINCETLLTSYVRSGRVNVRYCRAPTISRYTVGFKNASDPSMVSLREVITGVS